MTALENLLKKYNFQRRKTKPITAFEEIESQIGFSLPEDYRYYLENYQKNEVNVNVEFVALWDIDELVGINKETGIFENLPKTLGIGNNPSNEMIAIDFLHNNYRIVLSPFIDLATEYHINIGDSFTDFLSRMDNGKNWFD